MIDQPTNGGSRPVPDPTVLTDAAIAKLKESMTTYIDGQTEVRDTRFDALATAVELRASTHDQHHEDETRAVEERMAGHRALDESVHDTFSERFRDVSSRSEREARDNKVAVDAAFAAQKEAAQKQDEANQKAIDKSEKATAEKIDKLEQLFSAGLIAVQGKVDDVKERVATVEQRKVGAQEITTETRQSNTEHRASNAAVYAMIGLGITILLAVLTVIGFILARIP